MEELGREEKIEKLVSIYGRTQSNLKGMTDDELENEYEMVLDNDDGGMDPDDYLDSDAADEDFV